MTAAIPRLRMIAGPNGAGKSTIKTLLPAELLGVYINPDEIEKEINEQGFLNLNPYGLIGKIEEITAFFRDSDFLKTHGLSYVANHIRLSNGKLRFEEVEMNAYITSAMADFLRHKLLEQRVSFTFETVMSYSDKINLLEKAQSLGYRTYLYYIATEDPEINIKRVENRVRLGGHPVPEDKIRSRYARSLDLLMDAIRCTNRAFIFDNSSDGAERTWVAEITEGKTLELKTDFTPAWFKHAVWDKIASQRS